jgi:cytochrome oxidase Cu insertion factor (SCO1/SenC/PrrC family)
LAGLLAVMFGAPFTAHGPAIAHGNDTPSAFDAEAAIEYSQSAIGRTVGDYEFLGRDAGPVRLSDQRGKPVVVNLIYTACVHTCPIIVQTLARAVEVAQDALGADSFSVLTIGFDTDADTPARMRAYALSQGVDLPNWRFLATDEDTVRQGNLTSLSGLINRVRLFCTLYDPSSDRYRFDYSIFIGLAIAMASLGTIGTLLVRSWLRARRPHEPA